MRSASARWPPTARRGKASRSNRWRRPGVLPACFPAETRRRFFSSAAMKMLTSPSGRTIHAALFCSMLTATPNGFLSYGLPDAASSPAASPLLVRVLRGSEAVVRGRYLYFGRKGKNLKSYCRARFVQPRRDLCENPVCLSFRGVRHSYWRTTRNRPLP